jgi:hypothetical protein
MALDVITSAMKVNPTAKHAVGADRRTPAGRELGGQYAETYWAYKLLERDDANLEEAIGAATNWLNSRSTFVADFAQSGGRVDVYVTASEKGTFATELSQSTLTACVRLGVNLSLEIFRA